MGVCEAKLHHHNELTDEQRNRQKQIEFQIIKDRKKFESEIKLLLLGTGESGKSTFLKQLKIIHLKGFTKQERKIYKEIIHSNIITGTRTLLFACDKWKITLSDQNFASIDDLTSINVLSEKFLNPILSTQIKSIWSDSAFKTAVSRFNEVQVQESLLYFIDNFERISCENYIPNDQDILHARSKTTGIVEIEFDYAETHFRLVDVGGQRSERRKWIHCLQDVSAVLFCTAISEFDQNLAEDENVNRMHESLKLFAEICDTRWFDLAAIILFLNKKDLFEEKIKHSNLSICFPDYIAGSNCETAMNFIKEKFIAVNKNPEKVIYPHFTTATNKENVQFVFEDVRNAIINYAMDATF
eukprot:TRINITY_DN299_c0_g1_i2.p1 TRINITY_DN299_c0_g1~~TRINITY_DN299_c0_g1_i2.p1  ORF type:complete len:356 (+),score=137.82 TRINITY_DN299_c0_g1_i2:67-1134(+)